MSPRSVPNWVGPLFAAILLIGGYVGYRGWENYNIHSKECARRAAEYENMRDAMVESGGVQEDKWIAGSQAQLIDDLGSPASKLRYLETHCSGWMTKTQ